MWDRQLPLARVTPRECGLIPMPGRDGRRVRQLSQSDAVDPEQVAWCLGLSLLSLSIGEEKGQGRSQPGWDGKHRRKGGGTT
ncbi:hypothetical protein LY76DRAFT_586644 [Colletotrichum caudatum]|nr:hypothetical protein LY76DRAFT_586644 [Colletotrichum caudatum]